MPTMVPSRQPTKHQNRFAGCTATANPCSRPPMTSISEPEYSGGKRKAERDRKRQMERQRRHDRGDPGGHQRAAEDDRDDEEGEQREADEKPEPAHERDRKRKGEPGRQRPAGGRP